MKDVVNAFVKEIRPKRYLEIGLGDGRHFESVDVSEKVGIDPKGGKIDPPHLIYKGDSDDVFQDRSFQLEKTFDLIFVDGLHIYEQCLRDIYHSYDRLSEDGVILVHDVWPFGMPDPVASRERPPGNGPWCGDVYKVLFHFLDGFYYNKHEKDMGYAVISRFPGWLIIWRDQCKKKCISYRVTPFMDIDVGSARNLMGYYRAGKNGIVSDAEGAIGRYRNRKHE